MHTLEEENLHLNFDTLNYLGVVGAVVGGWKGEELEETSHLAFATVFMALKRILNIVKH